MDLQSVRFTLQRPLPVISSAVHPIILFLNNLHCCNGLLCDASGSGCCFFVGSDCCNKVSVGHALHRLVGTRR